jgi:hypothetical protein
MGKKHGRNSQERQAGMEDRGGRLPRSFLSPAELRGARSLPANPRARNPVWAFRIVDLDGPWCWSALGGVGLTEVPARFRDYESMTWEQIDGPTGSHGVEPWKLSRQAQARLTELRQDDASELFSLRIAGRRRVWGILDEHVLRILRWDPEHQVCPSPRKHT